MDHGENGAVLPRRLAKVISRQTCNHDLSRHIPRWNKGTEETPFRVAEANMNRVEVIVKKRRVPK